VSDIRWIWQSNSFRIDVLIGKGTFIYNLMELYSQLDDFTRFVMILVKIYWLWCLLTLTMSTKFLWCIRFECMKRKIILRTWFSFLAQLRYGKRKWVIAFESLSHVECTVFHVSCGSQRELNIQNRNQGTFTVCPMFYNGRYNLASTVKPDARQLSPWVVNTLGLCILNKEEKSL